jgi:hypothetical protein
MRRPLIVWTKTNALTGPGRKGLSISREAVPILNCRFGVGTARGADISAAAMANASKLLRRNHNVRVRGGPTTVQRLIGPATEEEAVVVDIAPDAAFPRCSSGSRNRDYAEVRQ